MNIYQKKENRIIGLDLGSQYLKIIEITLSPSRPVIHRSLSISIPNELDKSNPVILGQWLADSLKKENIKSRQVYISLPCHQVLFTQLDVPAGNESETRKMIELQLERHLPLPIDTVISDYFLLSTNPLGEQKIEVVSVKKEIIEFYKTIARSAGLVLRCLELSSLSVQRVAQSILQSDESRTLLNIGFSNTEITIVEDNRIVYTRSTPFGIKNLSQFVQSQGSPPVSDNFLIEDLTKIPDQSIDQWLTKLSFELRRNFESHLIEYGKPIPSKLVIIGGGPNGQKIIDRLKIKFSDSYQIIEFNQSLSQLIQKSPGESSVFIPVYGLVMKDYIESQSCDFINPKLFVEEPYHLPVGYKRIAYGIAGFMILVAVFYGLLYQKQNQLAGLKQEYVKYRPFLAQSEQITANSLLIRSWKSEQPSLVEILNELSNIWSDDAYVQVFTYDRTKEITVTGLAASNQAVADLITRLNQSNIFTGTKFAYSRVSKRNPTYPVEFGLSMKLKENTRIYSLTGSENGK